MIGTTPRLRNTSSGWSVDWTIFSLRRSRPTRLTSFLVHIIYPFIPNLFESSDVLNLKFNAMNSNFAYFCYLSFDNDENFIEPYMSIFDIHSINTEPFNLGTDENPRTL